MHSSSDRERRGHFERLAVVQRSCSAPQRMHSLTRLRVLHRSASTALHCNAASLRSSSGATLLHGSTGGLPAAASANRAMSSSAASSSSTAAGSSTVASAAAAAPASASSSEIYKGKSRVYTKTGDAGTTSLFNQQRRSKADDYFEALGDTDELNANLGVVRAHCQSGSSDRSEAAAASCAQLDEQLAEIQSRLFDVGAHLATPRQSSNAAAQSRTQFDEDHVTQLEHWIDAMEAHLPPLRNFILPSGGIVAAQLHVARAVCRRAERKTVPLVAREDADPVVGRYLNRLSDFLFVAARFAALSSERPETIWKKPRVRSTNAATPNAAENSSPEEQS